MIRRVIKNVKKQDQSKRELWDFNLYPFSETIPKDRESEAVYDLPIHMHEEYDDLLIKVGYDQIVLFWNS